MIKQVIINLLIVVSVYSQNEWKLEEWMEIFGQKDQKLGSYITNPKEIYKAFISDANQVGFYTFLNNKDTLPKTTFKPRGRTFLIDMNDDKYLDIVLHKFHNYPSRDTIFIYWGNSDGINIQNPWYITPKMINADDDDGFNFKLFDVNNDKKSDIILLTPWTSTKNGKYSGKVSFLINPISKKIPDFEILGDSSAAGFGREISSGDLNSDGFKDLIIKGDPYLGTDQRYTYLKMFLGRSNGTIDTTAWQIRFDSTEYFGENVFTSFDTNGDTKDDLLVTQFVPSVGKVLKVFFQNNNNISLVSNLNIKPYSFSNVFNAGDMNGDNINDIGLSNNSNDQGGFSYVFIISGGPNIDNKFDAAIGFGGSSYFGRGGLYNSVCPIKDINNDGCDDIIIGALEYGYTEKRGYFGVFLGSKNIKVTSVEDEKIISEIDYHLFQNYPNPFNSSTVIKYKLKNAAHVNLKIYDLLGKEIEVVINKSQELGDYNINFDGSKLKSGIYFSVLILTDNYGKSRTETRKMVLIK